MKAILEFDLPEEHDEFETCQNAANYYCALFDFSQEVLRKYRKYGELSNDRQEFIEQIESEFYNILNEHGVKL